MIKFPKPNEKTPKRAAKTTAPPKKVAARAAAASRAAKPRDVKLPGMRQPANARLEMLCQSLDTQRDIINNAKLIEKGDIAAALQEMTRRGYLSYKHSGIELIRVPGADKLRVHVVKEEGEMQAIGEADSDTDDPGNPMVADLGDGDGNDEDRAH